MRTPTVVNCERQFDIKELFFSTTNSKGVIQYGNEVFVRISGYSSGDLLGSPHSIVRHPDMPRSIFRLFWDALKAGEAIAAYVKNLAADGKFYWVLAVATPVENGYLSVRMKPSSPFFATVQKLYRQVWEIEQETTDGSHEAQIQAGLFFLSDQLSSLGFDDYPSFMHYALTQEIESRQALIAEDSQKQMVRTHSRSLLSVSQLCKDLAGDLHRLFGRTIGFRDANQAVLVEAGKVSYVADHIRTLSLNAKICAFRDGDAGTLREVANALESVSSEIHAISKEFSDQVKLTGVSLERLGFDIGVARLQVDVTRQFLSEIDSYRESMEPRALDSVAIILKELHQRSKRVFQTLDDAAKQLARLNTEVEKLIRNNRRLSFVEFAGQKEAVIYGATSTFSVVFNEVRNQFASGLESCSQLSDSMRFFQNRTKSLLLERDSIHRQLDAIEKSIRLLQDFDA